MIKVSDILKPGAKLKPKPLTKAQIESLSKRLAKSKESEMHVTSFRYPFWY